MKISFIQTGGTIDKDYKACEKHHGYNFEISEPAVKQVLKKMEPGFTYEILSVCKKDSLDLTDRDRENIYQKCEELDNDKIIITHGTDTLKETAKRLSSIKNKTIILTGAMKPEKFQNSDAEFNIGVAVGAAGFLKNGVYIAINGLVKRWNDYS
ncbi:MAG: asparaginase domain-containing protein [Patescibacteria group bacterium]|jgi:L-asparaginase